MTTPDPAQNDLFFEEIDSTLCHLKTITLSKRLNAKLERIAAAWSADARACQLAKDRTHYDQFMPGDVIRSLIHQADDAGSLPRS